MITTVRERRTTVAPPRTPVPAARPWDAAAVGLLAVVISAAGAARPSLWFDEAATISAGTRSLPELWAMLKNIDAVHGLYYLVMHGWFAVFPATEFLSRFSSSLAVGLAAAGVVVLGRTLANRATGLTAGLVFAILPKVTWAGMETRSYALTMAAAVWLTLFCVQAARRGRLWWWLPYTLMMALAALLNVFLILMVPVHAVAVITYARAERRWRVVAGWGAAAVTAVAAVAPFLLFTQTQLFQVGWIFPLGSRTVGMVLQEQYFDHATAFAPVAGLVLLAGAPFVRRMGEGAPRLALTTIAWIALPTATLLVYSALREPLYYPRYLSFTAPGFALLMGVCIVAVARSRAEIGVVVVVLAAAAAPNYLAQRGPYAKAGMDFSQVADVIDRYAAPGDCLVLDNSTTWMPGPIRPLLAARPAVYEKLHDYGRGLTALQRNRLWSSHVAIWAWADKMPDCPALWTVTERDPAVPEHERGRALGPGPRLGRAMAYQVPSRFGFRVVERWQFSFAQVTKSTRVGEGP